MEINKNKISIVPVMNDNLNNCKLTYTKINWVALTMRTSTLCHISSRLFFQPFASLSVPQPLRPDKMQPSLATRTTTPLFELKDCMRTLQTYLNNKTLQKIPL